ncbi:hypothetical protein [Eubacterium aggregans]|uniref:hypothetical protein n=1 Tax=Eubacterium aggregans TaxID=81409 RepID=UPI003F32F98D
MKFDPIFRETIGTIDPCIFPSDMWGYRILYYNIRITGVYVARVMLCETDRPLQDSDYSLLVFISNFLKTAMEKQSFSMNNHPKDLDLCFNQMLNRETIVLKKHSSI